MLCNNAEYKRMDRDMSLGQLYNVQNKINILYKALVGPTHFLQQFYNFSIITCKDSDVILSRGQCYKTFFVRSLRIFVIS